MKTATMFLAVSMLAVGSAHAATDWSTHARNAVETARLSGEASRQALALVDTAMRKAHDPAAAAVAAYVVLECLFPDQEPALVAELAVSLSHYPETQEKADALAHGRRVATAMLRSSATTCGGSLPE